MTELYIDNRRVEIASDASVMLSASIDTLTHPENQEEQRYVFRVPMTPKNRTLMGFPEQILSPEIFNQTIHPGEIRCKGTILLKGTIELIRCETATNGNGIYHIAFIVSPPEWIGSASEKKLRDSTLAFNGEINEQSIRQSWTNDSPVKFLPVKRDRYPEYGEEQTELNVLCWEDYHPFVHVKTLFDAIVGDAGYRIESQFLNEPFFLSLYMSGNYQGDENEEASLLMDFLAKRTAGTKTTICDGNGKVCASSLQTANSVGNLVDTSEDYSGNKRDKGAIYYGKCFRMIDGRPAFVPEQNIVAGFEFQMKYSSAATIDSSGYLSGIHRITWGDEILYIPYVSNPLTDKKNTPGNKGAYRAVNFNYSGGTNRVRVMLKSGVWQSFAVTGACYPFEISEEYAYSVYETYANGQYAATEDWAMYAEEDYNSINVFENEITVRSLPRLREKGVPVFFDTVAFEGGTPGSSFTLHSGSSIRPVFYSSPGAEAALTLPEVFDHEESQLKFIQAVAHLFGLHFYTDELTKTVYIEPRFTFLNHSHTVDWTDKIDTQKPVMLEEIGNDHYQAETYLYRTGDAAISRMENGASDSYGSWTASVRNQFAKTGEKKYTNPLFRSTKDEKTTLVNAPDASFIVVGNRNSADGVLNFPAKIVRYCGMKELSAGQCWGWPSYGTSYPLVAFHSAEDDWFTLCFDDAEGRLGLKNYYQSGYDLINNGKKLTLYLRLTPSDLEAILHPNSANRNFRGNFLFTIRGEKIRGRLIGLSGYNPDAGGIARCVFTVEL